MLWIALALKVPTLLALLWAFRRPDLLDAPGPRRRAVAIIAAAHLLLALLSLTGEKPSLSELFVAYPLFWSVLLRSQLRQQFPSPAPLALITAATCVLLWFEETWVIIDHRSPPMPHYLHYYGFYAGVAATIALLYSRYRYTVRQTFLVGGLWGALVEQQFAGPKLLLSSQPFHALVFAVYIFPVYGLYLAAPRLLFLEEFDRPTRLSRWQGLWLFLTISVLPLATWAAWSALLQSLAFDRTGVP